MPAVDVMDPALAVSAKEAAKSVAVLDELIKSLSISKNSAAEEQVLPAK
jgi:elongation factor 3